MQRDPVDEGRRWLAQAELDLDDARYNRDGGRHSLVCFLCQQAAEKALKAFLILREEEDIWGHSVGDLAERAAELDGGFAALAADGRSLDVFYIPTRYPNGLPGGLPARAFGPEDSERALDKAGRITGKVKIAFDEA
jgi:HEPN domain-containing protein